MGGNSLSPQEGQTKKHNLEIQTRDWHPPFNKRGTTGRRVAPLGLFGLQEENPTRTNGKNTIVLHRQFRSSHRGHSAEGYTVNQARPPPGEKPLPGTEGQETVLKFQELFSEGLIYDHAKLVRKTPLAEKETWETLLREQPHSFVTDAGGDPCAKDENASASGTKRASDSNQKEIAMCSRISQGIRMV